jgi:putative Mn2+ efflux pump MntP
MHLPTYLALMGAGLIYAIVRSAQLWSTNQLLFWIGIFVVIVNFANAVSQSLDPSEIQFKWMLAYIVPTALLVLASFSQYREIQIFTAAQVGVPLPPVLPGKSSDYTAAVWSHYASMVSPLVAAGIAKVVQVWVVVEEA